MTERISMSFNIDSSMIKLARDADEGVIPAEGQVSERGTVWKTGSDGILRPDSSAKNAIKIEIRNKETGKVVAEMGQQ
ncbi:Oidioi.mRNA.OKI2018_I69.chr1.g1962.t1.cds [Oikopleura dioica]|uniref:Oidioi.mRNA.OKI2018_I69.chr1.g1962.t1.cds n=1 Tax=Oikopleura dioica TaxID=34765 RepID=A0ABN7SPL6_OIKDI|nr:Oidioi.mRNA.OKI2018_I69.chr1.g1962.t1.cds [Oikopleura dioica]